MELIKSNGNEVMVKHELEVAKVLDYWSNERMRSAKPISLLMEEMFGDQLKLSEPANDPEKVNLSDSPFYYGGKLFGTYQGHDFTGSAQFCGKDNIILTAAHCIRSQNGDWYDNLIFNRAYKNGDSKQRVIITMQGTRVEWVRDKNLAYDYAFLRANIDSSVEHLEYKLGEPRGDVLSFGYPGNFDKGEFMYKATGSVYEIANQKAKMNGNKMGGGCSGGAWISDNKIVGVNSTSNLIDSVTSPVFDSRFEDLYNFMCNFKK